MNKLRHTTLLELTKPYICCCSQLHRADVLRYLEQGQDSSEIKRTLRDAGVTDQENVLNLIVRNIILHPHVNTRQGSSIDSLRVSYKFDADEKYNIGSRSRSSKSSKR